MFVRSEPEYLKPLRLFSPGTEAGEGRGSAGVYINVLVKGAAGEATSGGGGIRVGGETAFD